MGKLCRKVTRFLYIALSFGVVVEGPLQLLGYKSVKLLQWNDRRGR